MKSFKIIAVALLVFSIFSCQQAEYISVYDLKCENLTNPLGIDKETPRFSWKNKSDRNGAEQTAYQILVASDTKSLSEGKSDFWNSGKVESSASVLVSYEGSKIEPGAAGWWKVRVWDEAGNVSAWSKPARFSVGLIGESDWKASYVAFNTEKGYDECPQIYTEFDIKERNAVFLLHINSLGYHEVYINGQKVSDGVLTPAVSQFDKRSLTNTYDVSKLLQKGKNNIIIWLGSGWYTQGLPGVSNNGPVVRAQLERVSGNDNETIIYTDGNWKGRKSSFSRHGNWRPDRFGGEIVDGNLAINDLIIDNPENPWRDVVLADIPPHLVSPQMVEQNSIQDTIYAVSVTETGRDTFLVDMGTTLTGWLKINFSDLTKSQEVKIDYCDHLVDGQRFNYRNQWDKYIAAGTPSEVFINKFNYHGFRYVQITGLTQMPDIESVKAFLIHSDFESTARFECSDPDLNRIHDMVFYTLKCLGLGGYFVDCPQIERLGYGGDGNASTVTAQTMFNLAPLYHNWLDAWQDVIREDGSMPHTAPNPYSAGGGPYWCGFIISASWHTYQNYGDIQVLEKYYPTMQKWLGYVDQHSIDGLLKRWPNTGYRNWYLGDWATPEGVGNPNHLDERSVDLVNNCYLSVCYSQLAGITGVLGQVDEQKLYLEKKAELNKIIHETFFDSQTGQYGTGSQIDLIFPMLAGIVPQNQLDSLTKTLVERTENLDNGHLNTGLVGIPVMMEWAAKNSRQDYIYSMLKKKTYPGYLYMLENGATTTWEHWNGARSHIHNCYNGVGQWFYQAVGGIMMDESEPAFRKILIEPQVPKGVTWASTSQETPYGTLVVDWKINDNEMVMHIEIPVGSEAGLILPDKTSEITLNKSVQNVQQKQVTLKSGRNEVKYTL